jgi:hypothetical protein
MAFVPGITTGWETLEKAAEQLHRSDGNISVTGDYVWIGA